MKRNNWGLQSVVKYSRFIYSYLRIFNSMTSKGFSSFIKIRFVNLRRSSKNIWNRICNFSRYQASQVLLAQRSGLFCKSWLIEILIWTLYCHPILKRFFIGVQISRIFDGKNWARNPSFNTFIWEHTQLFYQNLYFHKKLLQQA